MYSQRFLRLCHVETNVDREHIIPIGIERLARLELVDLGDVRRVILLVIYRDERILTRDLREQVVEQYGVELKRGSKEMHFAKLGDGDDERGLEGG